MSQIIFKTTLLRSNPQVVRYFSISDTRTVRELLDTALAVHNWEPDIPIRLFFDQVEMDENNLISDYFTSELPIFAGEEKEWFLCAPAKDTPDQKVDLNDPEHFWIFRLEVEKAENTFILELKRMIKDTEHPCLLYAMGFHPSYSRSPGTVANRFFEIVSQVLDGTYHSWYAPISENEAESFLVDMEEINSELSRNKDAEEAAFAAIRLKWVYQRPLRAILEAHNLDSMKEMIRFHELGISYNVRKIQLIADLCDYFSRTSSFEKILEEMTLTDYLVFKNMVLAIPVGYQEERAAVDYLDSYCLVQRAGFDSAYIAGEFLSFFENYLNTLGDKGLLERKKVRDVILFCCKLYGITPRHVVEHMCQIMYPGEISREALNAIWNSISSFRNFGFQSRQYLRMQNYDKAEYREGIVYLTQVFHIGQTIPFLKKYDHYGMNYAYPDRETAFFLLKQGFSFSKETCGKLKIILEGVPRRYYYHVDLDKVIQGLYTVCQKGLTVEAVRDYLYYDMYLNVKADLAKQIFQVLESAAGEVYFFAMKGRKTSVLPKSV